MIIFAKDAGAGRRYRCVDTGDLIEICARPKDALNGKLVPLTTADGSFIHVNPIAANNSRVRSRNPAEPIVIPAFFKLESYDGPYTKMPARRTVVPKPPIPKNKKGRGKKGDTPWRGWAAKARYDMERILELIEAEGFWLADTFHYYRVGLQAETGMGVFKAGQLGFHKRPDGPLGEFPAKKLTTDPYLPWKVELRSVMAAEKWDEMLDMVRKYLRDFRKQVERRNRR